MDLNQQLADNDLFIEFSDIGLEDYILEFSGSIHARVFPQSRHTMGDLQKINLPWHENTIAPKRVFKGINLRIPLPQDTIVESSGPNHYDQSVANDYWHNENINNTSETNISNSTTINNGNTLISNEVTNLIDSSITNIQDTIIKKMEVSNNYTNEQLLVLEKNFNNIVNTKNNTTLIEQKIEQKIINITNEIKKEMQKDFQKKQAEIEDFLNS